MSSKMLKFVSTEKAMPEKRLAKNRVIADFDEIYDEFDTERGRNAGVALFAMWGSFLSGQLPIAQ